MSASDPIHEYILKADSEDLKEIMAEAGLNPAAEEAWVRKIVQKHIEAAAKEEKPNATSMQTFGTFIRLLRHQYRLEINDLAAKAKVEAKEIVRIENEPDYKPRPRTISQLSQCFDVSVDAMSMLAGLKKEVPADIREESVRFAANAKQVAGLDKEESRLIKQFVSFLSTKK